MDIAATMIRPPLPLFGFWRKAGPFVPGMLLSLAIGTAGGLIFYKLSLPLPWMLGPMCVVMLAAICKLPVGRTRPIRPLFAAVLGVTLGSAFTPAIPGHLVTWWPVLAATIIATVISGTAGYFYLSRIARFDRVTAFFGAMPAGLQEMTLQGGAAGGNEGQIALVHSVRIFLLVLMIPLAYSGLYGARSSGNPLLSLSPFLLTATDYAWLAGAGISGWLIACRIGMPNPAMLGPLLVSAAVHLTGLATTSPPSIFVYGSQVVIGSALGSGFIGAQWPVLRRSFLHGLVLVPILCGICLLVALIFAPLAGIPWNVVFLALAPGGTTEMSLIALALHAEVALVTSNQLVRILLINFGATSVFRIMRRNDV